MELCSKLEVISEPEFNERQLDYLARVERQVDDIHHCLQALSAARQDDMSAEKVAII